VSDESQLQVTRKNDDSSLALSKAPSSLILRGRRDAAILDARCNKCGELRELIFSGCVCASCSDALDREWAGSTVTDWVLTTLRDWGDGRDACEVVLRDTGYAQMKTFWAHWRNGIVMYGHVRLRQPTQEEAARPKSQWATESDVLRGSTIRPATRDEVAWYEETNRKRSIAGEAEEIIRETRRTLGIDDEAEPHQFARAAEEIAQRLRQEGLFEELAKMRREESDTLRSLLFCEVADSLFLLLDAALQI
jgi:hypothetical protein